MTNQIEFNEKDFYKKEPLPWVRLTDPDQGHDIKCPSCGAIYDSPFLGDLTGKIFKCDDCRSEYLVKSTLSYHHELLDS